MQRKSWSTDRQFTHCTDNVTWTTPQPDVTQWSNNDAQLPRQQRRIGNRVTQTRERTRKRHRNMTKILSRMSVNTSTHPKNLAQRSIRVVLLHGVATHTAKDHQRQHVIGTAQDITKRTTHARRTNIY